MAVDGILFDVPDTLENARVFGYPGSRPGTQAAFPKVRLVLLIEAGTHLIIDALMCPYRIGERVRAKKLLRSVTQGMLLMWDRGLHSYVMVRATLAQKSDYLGRIPKNVKFPVKKVLSDGSYLSWIAPDGKSKKKGGTKIMVRVIEYTIDTDGEPEIYRLITSLTDIALFPALLLAMEYHKRWEVENTIDELKVHLLGRKTPIRSLNPREEVLRNLWLASGSLGCAIAYVSSCRSRSNFSFTIKFYRKERMWYAVLSRSFNVLSQKKYPFFNLASDRNS